MDVSRKKMNLFAYWTKISIRWKEQWLLKLNNSNVVAQNRGWSVGLDRIKQLTYTLKTQNLMCIIFKHLVISSYCVIFNEWFLVADVIFNRTHECLCYSVVVYIVFFCWAGCFYIQCVSWVQWRVFFVKIKRREDERLDISCCLRNRKWFHWWNRVSPESYPGNQILRKAKINICI